MARRASRRAKRAWWFREFSPRIIPKTDFAPPRTPLCSVQRYAGRDPCLPTKCRTKVPHQHQLSSIGNAFVPEESSDRRHHNRRWEEVNEKLEKSRAARA